MHKNTIISISILSLLLLLTACKSSVRPAPPVAKIGDAAVSVTIKAPERKNFDKGSNVNVTLADISVTGSQSIALAGDIITLTQIDSEVRIKIPIDREKVEKCTKPDHCGVFVQVTKGGNLVYANTKPVPYTIDTKNIIINLKKESFTF